MTPRELAEMIEQIVLKRSVSNNRLPLRDELESLLCSALEDVRLDQQTGCARAREEAKAAAYEECVKTADEKLHFHTDDGRYTYECNLADAIRQLKDKNV